MEAPQVDILETAKEKFVDLISELDDTQFHSFEQFAQSALRKYKCQYNPTTTYFFLKKKTIKN